MSKTKINKKDSELTIHCWEESYTYPMGRGEIPESMEYAARMKLLETLLSEMGNGTVLEMRFENKFREIPTGLMRVQIQLHCRIWHTEEQP